MNRCIRRLNNTTCPCAMDIVRSFFFWYLNFTVHVKDRNEKIEEKRKMHASKRSDCVSGYVDLGVSGMR